MSKEILEDSDMPEPLNTPQKQEKRAKQLAADILNKKARSVAAPKIQGFFSRTRIITMVGGQKIVIQFRVEPLDTEYFERARSILGGDAVPSIQHVEDEDLERVGITTYAMSHVPGDLWFHISDSKVEQRVAIASSLGTILARGFVQSDSALVVKDYILPALNLIRDSLDSSTRTLAPHVDRMIVSAPALKHLPLWISHHDLNEVNVLVNEEHKVSGIVDWELSRDLPFGMGLHRVCDTIVGRNVRGALELPPGYNAAEAAFWDALWKNMRSDARVIIENNLESFGAAINIGSLFFACLKVEPSAQEWIAQLPSGRQLSFLKAALTYCPPHTRGKNGPFGTSFML